MTLILPTRVCLTSLLSPETQAKGAPLMLWPLHNVCMLRRESAIATKSRYDKETYRVGALSIASAVQQR